jgi:hypothetical protein
MRDPPDPACADRPYTGTLQVSRTDGTNVADVSPDADGTFSIALPPGIYRIGTPPTSSMLPRCDSVDVTVVPNQYADVHVSCDTGIR